MSSSWYRYVDPARSLIAQGRAEQALQRIKATFHEYVAAPPWEEACRQFLWRVLARGALPEHAAFSRVGRWWNAQHEIDIVAQEDGRTVLAGSCKWTNRPMGTRDFHDLEQALSVAARELRPASDLWYALFSREGFDPALRSLAGDRSNRILLFTVDDLFAQ